MSIYSIAKDPVILELALNHPLIKEKEEESNREALERKIKSIQSRNQLLYMANNGNNKIILEIMLQHPLVVQDEEIKNIIEYKLDPDKLVQMANMYYTLSKAF